MNNLMTNWIVPLVGWTLAFLMLYSLMIYPAFEHVLPRVDPAFLMSIMVWLLRQEARRIVRLAA